tara:strand:+ start:459 stop:641 length:183 start_codon:yes stop_codon:yes gene_type:complete
MRFILIIPLIALLSIVVGTIAFEYSIEYSEERELENLIISCMKQFGHYSDELVSCLNNDL